MGDPPSSLEVMQDQPRSVINKTQASPSARHHARKRNKRLAQTEHGEPGAGLPSLGLLSSGSCPRPEGTRGTSPSPLLTQAASTICLGLVFSPFRNVPVSLHL